MIFRSVFALAVVMSLAGSAVAQEPAGLWSMANGKVTVKVRPCGGTICGTIAGLKEPISKIDGKPKVDRENPDPALRKRPLIGLPILIGMKSAGEDTWKGAIYNPDDGNTYSATLTLAGSKMKVKGCVAGILCKTNNFVRLN